jgi:hypothetical protein
MLQVGATRIEEGGSFMQASFTQAQCRFTETFLPILQIYELWELDHIAIHISYFEVLVKTSKK